MHGVTECHFTDEGIDETNMHNQRLESNSTNRLELEL